MIDIFRSIFENCHRVFGVFYICMVEVNLFFVGFIRVNMCLFVHYTIVVLISYLAVTLHLQPIRSYENSNSSEIYFNRSRFYFLFYNEQNISIYFQLRMRMATNVGRLLSHSLTLSAHYIHLCYSLWLFSGSLDFLHVCLHRRINSLSEIHKIVHQLYS
jgi:hypothetical protein